MHIFLPFILTGALILVGATRTLAATIALADWGFNINGTTYCNLGPCDQDGLAPNGLPTFFDISGFDFSTGLGSLTITFAPGVAGDYAVLAFFDHEIDEEVNTFFNETGSAVGTPATGQSWEIDEPGFVFGDIFSNFTAGTLDNSNGVPQGSEDDVSLALGWEFALAEGELAVIGFVVSESVVPSGFHLAHTDPDSGAMLYFSSMLQTQGAAATPVPEPGTVLLLGSGLAGLLGYTRRRRCQQGI